MNNHVLWLTGLSASGKTTLAQAIVKKLKEEGCKVHHLDGDEVRDKSKDFFGFDKEGRDKNIRAAIDLAKKYQDEGFLVVASFISPYKCHRDWGREALPGYIEVFIDTPLSECERRDPKGLYKKARAGEIKLFTGIDDPFEAPDNPDLHIKTMEMAVYECLEEVMRFLK